MADTFTGMVIREYITPGLIGLALGGSLYFTGNQLIKDWRTASCGENFNNGFKDVASQYAVSALTIEYGSGYRCKFTLDNN